MKRKYGHTTPSPCSMPGLTSREFPPPSLKARKAKKTTTTGHQLAAAGCGIATSFSLLLYAEGVERDKRPYYIEYRPPLHQFSKSASPDADTFMLFVRQDASLANGDCVLE